MGLNLRAPEAVALLVVSATDATVWLSVTAQAAQLLTG